MTFRIAIPALLSVAAFAQTPVPPAEVDQALRARVSGYYAAIQKEEYRKAENFIAEDTKDMYYKGAKPKVEEFKIKAIDYSENFTRATVTTECTQQIRVPEFPLIRQTAPVPTTWKVENGEWVLYIDQTKMVSILGITIPTDKVEKGVSPLAAGMAAAVPKTADFLFGKVKADRPSLDLVAEATERVTLTNTSDFPVSLAMGDVPNGMSAKLDRGELAAGEKAVVTIHAGGYPRTGTVYVQLIPTQEMVAIAIKANK